MPEKPLYKISFFSGGDSWLTTNYPFSITCIIESLEKMKERYLRGMLKAKKLRDLEGLK